MVRVMPCVQVLVGGAWLSDITVEGMRLGERLHVLAARREPCWAELLNMVGVDVAGLALLLPLVLVLLSGRGLADALRGVLVC